MAATAPSTQDQAAQTLEHLDEDLKRLPERWLPRTDELRDFLDRWEQAWNTHDLDALETMVTEDFTWQDPGMFGETVHGRAEFRAFTEILFRAMPDVRFEGLGAPYFATEGDAIALRWRWTGTFTGDLAFWEKRFGASRLAYAPTGRRVDLEGVDLYEFRNGLISHWTIVYDLLGLSQQLGLFPPVDSPMRPLMVRAQRLTARLRRR
jgi:steroid delta-isomerase-like uncharacterized protein